MVSLTPFETGIRQRLVSSIHIRGGGGVFEATIFQFQVEFVKVHLQVELLGKVCTTMLPKNIIIIIEHRNIGTTQPIEPFYRTHKVLSNF